MGLLSGKQRMGAAALLLAYRLAPRTFRLRT